MERKEEVVRVVGKNCSLIQRIAFADAVLCAVLLSPLLPRSLSPKVFSQFLHQISGKTTISKLTRSLQTC